MSVSLVGHTAALLSAASASGASPAGAARDAVGIAMLKKSLDLQQHNAAHLLQALPSPQPSNPAHLGQNIDLMA